MKIKALLDFISFTRSEDYRNVYWTDITICSNGLEKKYGDHDLFLLCEQTRTILSPCEAFDRAKKNITTFSSIVLRSTYDYILIDIESIDSIRFNKIPK